MITGPRDAIKRARALRSEMTLPEVLLWRQLRTRPGAFKFRRQHAAGVYVLDFFCAAANRAIEVDGQAHDNADRSAADARRSHFLRSQGVSTTRVPAKSILNNMEAVVIRIVQICEERSGIRDREIPVPLHQPAAGPPPRAGEEL